MSSSDKYRSYLSLMPSDDDDDDDKEINRKKSAEIHEERKKILAHFQALTGQEQEEQRENWTEQLQILEAEIAQLKAKLGIHLHRRNQLRINLGLDMIRSFGKKSVDHITKEVRDLIQVAKISASAGTGTGTGSPETLVKSIETDNPSISIENNNAKF